MRTIELLAPAKDLACGIAAIDHGADAVYIGAPRFGARSAAGNPVEDIATLCRYAHLFGAKVYVTVNTLVYDEEIQDTQLLLKQLADAGADAFLIQDMAVKELTDELNAERIGLKPIECHASTQTDNRSADKVAWLSSIGFNRVVLARELSLNEIKEIHEKVPYVELEAFVHGALCVSYSGLCYASENCFHRSANRGECAQFCRLKFDLVDSDGKIIERQRHLLSLKDLCLIDMLEPLMEAGVTSLKIEGRLKDIDYVKNVTAAYSQRLNEIIRHHPLSYRRASQGNVSYSFQPDLRKTFNRGFTHYYLNTHRDTNNFLNGRQPDVISPDTPKALGEYVGRVKEIMEHSFTVSGTASFANGDGLCFFTETPTGNTLQGVRINKALGNRLYPLSMPPTLRKGIALYRNNDQAFQRLLSGKTAKRQIPVNMKLCEMPDGFELSIGNATAELKMEKQLAQKPQQENIVKQLSKLGTTPCVCQQVEFIPRDFNFFIPSSLLADLRRRVIEKFLRQIEESSCVCHTESKERLIDEDKREIPFPIPDKNHCKFPYLYNISNALARQFWQGKGLKAIVPAFECAHPTGQALIMQCRHCLRFSLGYCKQHGAPSPPWHEPLYLVLHSPHGGRSMRFRLHFNCSQCQMEIYASNPQK